MHVPVHHRRRRSAPDSAVWVLVVVSQGYVIVKSRNLRGCCTIRTATGSLIGAVPSVYATGEAVIHAKPCPYAPGLQLSPSSLNTSRLHQPTRCFAHLVPLSYYFHMRFSLHPSSRSLLQGAKYSSCSCRPRNRPIRQDGCSIAIFAMQVTA